VKNKYGGRPTSNAICQSQTVNVVHTIKAVRIYTKHKVAEHKPIEVELITELIQVRNVTADLYETLVVNKQATRTYPATPN
jgi:hypothetical protein